MMWRRRRRMRRESTCVDLPLPNTFCPKTQLAGKSQISPHFLDSVTRNLLVFWKHEREAPHGRRKRRRRRGAIG
jgi:hypothetical protein